MTMFPGNRCNDAITPNDKEQIEASVASESSKVYAATKLAKFFEVDLTLKIFGQVVFSWHFPPSNN